MLKPHTLALASLTLLGLASTRGPAQALVKDIRPGRLGSLASAGPELMLGMRGLAFFAASDGTAQSLWRSDASTAGTYVLKTGIYDVRELTRAEDRLYFGAKDAQHGEELWLSDGTTSGTRLVADLDPGSGGAFRAILGAHGARCYFTAKPPSAGVTLYVTDGGTPRALRGEDRNFSLIAGTRVHALGANVYFRVKPTGRGYELWRSDGTAAGTSKVYAFSSYTSSIQPVLAWKGKLWCSVQKVVGRQTVYELWTSDGSSAGTKLFHSGQHWNFGASGGGASQDTLFFAHRASATARAELWASDGTQAGTRLVSSAVHPNLDGPLGLGDGRVFFAGQDAQNDVEPWVSDGTSAGTFRLLDVHPTSFGMPRTGALPAGRLGDGVLVLFRARDPQRGWEFFVSDGTNAGTKLAFDHAPGANLTSYPAWGLARAGGNYVFHGDDGTHGGEPYALALASYGGSLIEPYGDACAGGGGVPVHDASGAPRIGNASFALEGARFAAKIPVVQIVSARPASIALPPCTLLVDLSAAIFTGHATGATGELSIPLGIPQDPKLLGIQFYSQLVGIDSAGSLLGKFALSNGLRVLIGR